MNIAAWSARYRHKVRRHADAANRAKDEFLATVSHELRTPLNSLLILAKLLADNPDANLTSIILIQPSGGWKAAWRLLSPNEPVRVWR